MLKLKVLLIAIILATHAPTAYSLSFGSSDFYEEECLKLFKKTYSITYFVKAADAEKIAENKYDFTPTVVTRGKETVFTRHYCEYYPDEDMVYIGIAKSVIEANEKKELIEKKRKILVEKKNREAAQAAAKHAAELQEIQDTADIEAAEASAKYAAEAAAKKEAQVIIQYRKEKIEAQKKAEAERIRREKYDPIANNCLKEGVLSDFQKSKKTFRIPSRMVVGSNRTAFFKPVKARVLKYTVSEGAINIDYIYTAQLFYKIKRNGEIKDGYDSYNRKGSFICEISGRRA